MVFLKPSHSETSSNLITVCEVPGRNPPLNFLFEWNIPCSNKSYEENRDESNSITDDCLIPNASRLF